MTFRGMYATYSKFISFGSSMIWLADLIFSECIFAFC